jgi:glycosyltransferase involved in cell wall biosynthesis
MNIVIIPSWFPTKGNQINGSFFLEQANALARFGHKVIVVNVSYVGRKDYLIASNYKITDCIMGDVRVISKTTPGLGVSRRKKQMYQRFYFNLTKIFKKYKLSNWCDVIHCHCYLPAGYYGCMIGKKYDIPVVVTEHASNLIQKKDIVNKSMLDYAVHSSNAFISVGDALNKSILELTDTSNDLYIIPNIVSPLFVYTKKSFTSSFRFISVGSLQKRKNHDLVIRAFQKFNDLYPQSELIIVGDGPEKQFLKRLIDELMLKESVVLLGSLSRENTYREISLSDVFILASQSETFGVVYAEALMVGRPAIAKKNGGSEYIINDTNGIVLDSDKYEDFFLAMKYLYLNYNSYNQEKISLDAQSKYSDDVISRRITSIYEKVVNTHEE